jgi:predicted esterase
MTPENTSSPDIHAGQPVLTLGAPLREAGAALILIHGRGSTARDILTLAHEFDAPGVAFLAPQAAGGTWYPNRFIAPVESNEPWLTSALGAVGRVLENVEAAGIPHDRIALLGFSQGACLALEYAARHPALLGGVAGLSGGLIENGDRQREYAGNLEGTPVFLGCSDVDPHIPVERVYRSEEVLRGLGALVTTRIYPGMGHTVNRDEIDWVQAMLTFLIT